MVSEKSTPTKQIKNIIFLTFLTMNICTMRPTISTIIDDMASI